MKKIVKYNPLTGNKYYGDLNFSEVKGFGLSTITEVIRDNVYFPTSTLVTRNFPENSNLEIGKKYIMNFCFHIYPGGIWNGNMGLCYLSLTENNVKYILSAWPLNALFWQTFQGCLSSNPCMQFSSTSWGAYFSGSKVVTAQDINGDGKVPLTFEVLIGHPQWYIYHETMYNYIEFVKIEED